MKLRVTPDGCEAKTKLHGNSGMKISVMSVVRAIAAVLVISAPVLAAPIGIVGVSNVVVDQPVPASFLEGVLESDTAVFLFLEKLNYTMTSDARVNTDAEGTYDQTADLPLELPVIPAGTRVNTYFVHFDKIGNTTDRVSLDGYIDFSLQILGVQLLTPRLNISSSRQFRLNVPYNTDASAGLELSATQDIFTWSGNRLSFHLETGAQTDQFRVLTLVPEPTTMFLFGTGLIGLAAAVRRRRK